MATRTGLIPATVKPQGRTRVTSVTVVKKLCPAVRGPRNSKAPATKSSGLTSIKVKCQNVATPQSSSLYRPVSKKTVFARTVGVSSAGTNKSQNQAKQVAKLQAVKRKTDSSFEPGRSLAKQKTPNRNGCLADNRSPKSILKKEPSIQETKMKSDMVECGDSRHVKFKSRATDQISMRAKLNAWLAAKGKTPSRCRHLMCFDAEMSAKKKKDILVDRTITQDLLSQQLKILKDETTKRELFPSANSSVPHLDDADNKENVPQSIAELVNSTENTGTSSIAFEDSQDKSTETSGTKLSQTSDVSSRCGLDETSKLKSMLEECLTLFNAGCPIENIIPWLREIEDNIPAALTFAPYYVCRAKVLGAFPQMVLDVFCDAVRNGAQPRDLLAAEMKSMISQWVPLITDSAKTRTLKEEPALLADSAPSADEPPPSTATAVEKQPSTCSNLSSQPDAAEAPPVVMSEAAEARPVVTEGSVLKFNISSVPRLMKRTSERDHVTVVTPVRRSARLSNRHSTPGSGLRRDLNSVSDLSSAERQAALFRHNLAITGK